VVDGVRPIADRFFADLSLFHASEEADIQVFHPRAFGTAPDARPVVWAIDAVKLTELPAAQRLPKSDVRGIGSHHR
jgi:hypothetical protein